MHENAKITAWYIVSAQVCLCTHLFFQFFLIPNITLILLFVLLLLPLCLWHHLNT